MTKIETIEDYAKSMLQWARESKAKSGGNPHYQTAETCYEALLDYVRFIKEDPALK